MMTKLRLEKAGNGAEIEEATKLRLEKAGNGAEIEEVTKLRLEQNQNCDFKAQEL